MRYYQTAIANGIILLLLIALLPLVPYYIRHRKRGMANPLRLLAFCSMVLQPAKSELLIFFYLQWEYRIRWICPLQSFSDFRHTSLSCY